MAWHVSKAHWQHCGPCGMARRVWKKHVPTCQWSECAEKACRKMKFEKACRRSLSVRWRSALPQIFISACVEEVQLVRAYTLKCTPRGVSLWGMKAAFFFCCVSRQHFWFVAYQDSTLWIVWMDAGETAACQSDWHCWWNCGLPARGKLALGVIISERKPAVSLLTLDTLLEHRKFVVCKI